METDMASINGIAHVQLTVTDMQRSVPFYRTLLQSLEMTVLRDTPNYFYCIGGRTGVAIAPAAAGLENQPFEQGRAGLHHLCFRARSRADVDAIHETAHAIGAKIVRAPREDDWAPGYYSVLFEDPDGIRIEANFVPGKGHLDKPSGA
jgi:catechol 2,3-dioxygenase-like lactoylglutathione lyase family enzyme